MGRTARSAWIIRLLVLALGAAIPWHAEAAASAQGVALNANADCSRGDLDLTLSTAGANRESWLATNAGGATLVQGEAATLLGNFSGTAVGTKLKMAKPEAVIVASVAITAAMCVIVALAFGIVFAVIGMYVSAVANALCKIALDALIQRDVVETLRSSAFARSETFLQLAWVVGAAIGVVLPSSAANGGAIGFWVAALVMGVVAVIVVLRLRLVERTTAARAETTTERIHPGRLDLRKSRP